MYFYVLTLSILLARLLSQIVYLLFPIYSLNPEILTANVSQIKSNRHKIQEFKNCPLIQVDEVTLKKLMKILFIKKEKQYLLTETVGLYYPIEVLFGGKT